MLMIGDEHTLPVDMGAAGNQYIKFKKLAPSDTKGFFDSADPKLQEAIEKSSFFERKEITLLFAVQEEAAKQETEGPVVEYPEVKSFQEAKAVLTSEPFNVPKTSPTINTPEKIFKKAAELGISFPNLTA